METGCRVLTSYLVRPLNLCLLWDVGRSTSTYEPFQGHTTLQSGAGIQHKGRDPCLGEVWYFLSAQARGDMKGREWTPNDGNGQEFKQKTSLQQKEHHHFTESCSSTDFQMFWLTMMTGFRNRCFYNKQHLWSWYSENVPIEVNAALSVLRGFSFLWLKTVWWFHFLYSHQDNYRYYMMGNPQRKLQGTF